MYIYMYCYICYEAGSFMCANLRNKNKYFKHPSKSTET